MLTRLRSLVAVAAAGVVPAILLYAHTRQFGFDYDDYHFVRPFAWADVAAAFHGPWDASGIELPYYRPLTICAYALRFALFGINSDAYHVVSIAGFAVAAALAGIVAWGLTRRRLAGAFTALFFAVHPAMPYALVSWVTNQMHLQEVILILAALAWWNTVRARTFVWWIPLWILAAAAFLTKEDGVMLLPAIVVLHWVKRRWAEPSLPRIPVPFAVGSAILIALLIVTRSQALADVPGRSLPHVSLALANYTSGLNRVFRLVPPDRHWQEAASWFVIVLPLVGVLFARRTSAEVRFGMMAGVLLATIFNLPFVFVTKNEQLHVVAAGAVLLLGASSVSLLDTLRPRALNLAAGAVLVVGAFVCALVSRDISSDFRPFGPIVLSHDKIVRTWAAVPAELLEYLERKQEPNAQQNLSANPADAIPLVVFHAHPYETSGSGIRYRWMSAPRLEMLVTASARELTLPVRHEIGPFGEAVDARIEVDGRELDRLHLADDGWHHSRIPLRGDTVPSMMRMHRVVLWIDHAWIPSSIIPGSTDSRTLGLQIGVPELK